MTQELFHTYLLSHVFGLYLIIMAIILASRANFFRTILNTIDPTGVGLFTGGSIWLLLGIFLVCIHSMWGSFLVNLVTIMCWLILIKAILILAFPRKMITFSQKLYSGKGYYVMVIVCALVGIILVAKGYSLVSTDWIPYLPY